LEWLIKIREGITMDNLDSREKALKALGVGHLIWSPHFAKKVCDTLGIEWNNKLVHRLQTDTSHENPKYNTYINPDYENDLGVNSLALSRYCAQALGVEEKAPFMNGRGSQAEMYALVIRRKLEG